MSESTDRDFSNINHSNKNERKIPRSNKNNHMTAVQTQSGRLNREYLVSLNGILTIVIIVSNLTLY